MSESKSSVAFLGMGLMGVPMSLNLLKAGYPIRCYNRTRSKTQSVVDAGGIAFDTPELASSEASVVFICVTDGPDVEKVLFGSDGASTDAKPETLFIDVSTIAPSMSISIGHRLREMGFRFLEAPVTGGTIGARNGTLSILVGGSGDDFQSALPMLQAMGTNITHCGGLGAGQGVKLCNQIMGAMNLLGVCEAFSLSSALGIDPKVLVSALDKGAASSWALLNLGPKINAMDWSPGFMVDTQQKDMRLVAEAAEQLNVPLPGSALVTQLWRTAQAYGFGQEGIHALSKVLQMLRNPGKS